MSGTHLFLSTVTNDILLCKASVEKHALRDLVAFPQPRPCLSIHSQQILFVFPPACPLPSTRCPTLYFAYLLFCLLISFSFMDGAFRKHNIWTAEGQHAMQNALSGGSH